MPARNSTRSTPQSKATATTRGTRGTTPPGKPEKPRPDFPLFAHAAGVWAKKIRGKLHYFGPWDDPEGALKKYEAEAKALHEGRVPRTTSSDGATVKDAVYGFLDHKQALVDSGELAPVTFVKYKRVAQLVLRHFTKGRLAADLGPDDFAKLRKKMAADWGHLRVRDFVQHVRSIFKHAHDSGLIDRPLNFGPGFARPSKRVLRMERAKKPLKLFTPPQLRALLRKAGQPLKAMILLGINCGFGNADCGNLPLKALNLAAGWVDFPRPKTGALRRCPLWPETIEALREAIAQRPAPADVADTELVFLTVRGNSWYKAIEDSPLSKETAKLLKDLKLYRGNGLGFYTLRHCFETIGGEVRDQVAVDFVMGHARDDVASAYREKIGDDRLRAVVDHVRAWLFSGTIKKTSAQPA